MKISIPVNHNFFEESPILEPNLCDAFSVKNVSANRNHLRDSFSSIYELKLGAEQLRQVRIFNFKRSKIFKPDENRLILKLFSKENISQNRKEYFVQTGLYAGVVFYKGCKFNITTKYGDAFLKRMLNFVHDIYVDSELVSSKKDHDENQFLFIIAYLFIQSLEKAAVLGLPQHYKKHQERSHKVRGSINFNEFMKRDIPFQGKLTSTFSERMYLQEIVDVLYLALRKLEKLFGKEIHSRLLGLNQQLKQNFSGQYPSYATIQKAKSHQAIGNPVYSGFKKALEYAEIILLEKDLIPENDKQSLAITGYLFDISELYELYLEKLLSKNFPEWSVSGQEELPLYQQQFYRRPMFPDIVMKHRVNKNVVVFDAKFKKMEMNNCDVDRSDLHQIHSYSGYYGRNLIASGLIFPLSKEIKKDVAHATSIYGNDENTIAFMVDGVYVNENQSIAELIAQERAFVSRVASVINRG